jgi:hypothetical protein
MKADDLLGSTANANAQGSAPVKAVERTRWRLNDPGEENRVRWTKVHYLATPYRALCGVMVAEWPYDRDANEQIPDDADVCRRCAKAQSGR